MQIDAPLDRRGASIAGVALRVESCSDDDLDRLAARIRHYASDGVNVTVDVSVAAHDTEVFETFSRGLGERGVRAVTGLTLYSRKLPPSLRAFSIISECELGHVRRFVNIGDPASVSARQWRFLWRHRSTRWAVWPVYGDRVRAGSPLLNDERAGTVLPRYGLHVPSATAWLAMHLRLDGFTGPQGHVSVPAMERALDAAVTCAEELIAALEWPDGLLRTDAYANRRVAINIDGIGDLVLAQAGDPSDLAIQRDLYDLMHHIRRYAWSRSSQLADAKGPLCAISKLGMKADSSFGAIRGSWADQWKCALERHAVRHRNLLAMSPYTVIPERRDASDAWEDLLPLLNFADVCCFAAPRMPAAWKLSDFKGFHCRAAAQLMPGSGGGIIATRV